MTEILDTCRIFRDIDKHPLPDHNCKIDVMFKCGSMLLGCDLYLDRDRYLIMFKSGLFLTSSITQWRLSK